MLDVFNNILVISPKRGSSNYAPHPRHTPTWQLSQSFLLRTFINSNRSKNFNCEMQIWLVVIARRTFVRWLLIEIYFSFYVENHKVVYKSCLKNLNEIFDYNWFFLLVLRTLFEAKFWLSLDSKEFVKITSYIIKFS